MRRRDFLKIGGTALGGAALLHLTTTGIAHGEAPASFRIVQLSDTHVGHPLGTKAFERAVDLINAADPQPDLVLFTGDLTHDSDDAAEHARRMKTFRAIADRLRVKTRYHVPGEHDAALDGGTLFRENFGETHYAFDHRGVHFVALDNVSLGKPAVGAAQLAWLQKDLARYGRTTPVVVFTHRPLFDLRPDWEWFTSDGASVTNVLAPYDNVTVLYGHIHRADHRVAGRLQHHAARSLIFAFPDPAAAAEKKPIPFDPAQPFRNLGVRYVRNAPLAIDDVELSLAEIAGANGVQQIVRTTEAPRVVEISAKRFEFTPKEVHLRVGEPVTVRLVATDRAHGLLLKDLGIDLDAGTDKPDSVTITPNRRGTYDAICDHYCGAGHGGMRMTFVVE
ncbi:MAG TPA: metallophosphoesterase [Thermoanaerobaculia bacterium]|jgi:plastocyanin